LQKFRQNLSRVNLVINDDTLTRLGERFAAPGSVALSSSARRIHRYDSARVDHAELDYDGELIVTYKVWRFGPESRDTLVIAPSGRIKKNILQFNQSFDSIPSL
jgi:hypothetical protein